MGQVKASILKFLNICPMHALNEKIASRLSVTTSKHIGLRNKDKWEELQNDMINTMVKFEKAFKERIRNL